MPLRQTAGLSRAGLLGNSRELNHAYVFAKCSVCVMQVSSGELYHSTVAALNQPPRASRTPRRPEKGIAIYERGLSFFSRNSA